VATTIRRGKGWGQRRRFDQWSTTLEPFACTNSCCARDLRSRLLQLYALTPVAVQRDLVLRLTRGRSGNYRLTHCSHKLFATKPLPGCAPACVPFLSSYSQAAPRSLIGTARDRHPTDNGSSQERYRQIRKHRECDSLTPAKSIAVERDRHESASPHASGTLSVPAILLYPRPPIGVPRLTYNGPSGTFWQEL
jgi:hypothetical protein